MELQIGVVFRNMTKHEENLSVCEEGECFCLSQPVFAGPLYHTQSTLTVCMFLHQASEVKAMIASDRSGLFANGVTVAGRKCTLLRDNLNVDGQNTMDIKMKTSEKEPDPFSFTIGRSHKGENMTDQNISICQVCALYGE